MPPGRRELVIEILGWATDFRIDVAQEALAPHIGDEGGVDRGIFDVEAAGFEPADQPLAMTARFGEAKQAKEVVEEIPARGCEPQRERSAEGFHGGAEVVFREFECGVE